LVHDNDGWYEWNQKAVEILWGKITEAFKEFTDET
jgi:hypothetical protein